MTSPMQKPYEDKMCESCSVGLMRLPSNNQEWHLVCDECGAIKFCYTPLPHQIAFHKDSSKYRLFAGGY